MTDMYYPIYAEGLYNSLMQVSTEQLALQSSGTLAAPLAAGAG